MNKYIVPVCDLVEGIIEIKRYLARSISECEDKIIDEYTNIYDIIFEDYSDFVNIMNSKYDIAIGDITDIETL